MGLSKKYWKEYMYWQTGLSLDNHWLEEVLMI